MMKIIIIPLIIFNILRSNHGQQPKGPNGQSQDQDTEMVLDLVKDKGVLYIVNDYQNHLMCLINKIFRKENSSKELQQYLSSPTNVANKSMLNYVLKLNERLKGNLTIHHKDIDKLIDDFIEIRNHLKSHTSQKIGKISVMSDPENIVKVLEAVERHLDLLKLNKLSDNNETLEKGSIMQVYDNILTLKGLLEKVLKDRTASRMVVSSMNMMVQATEQISADGVTPPLPRDPNPNYKIMEPGNTNRNNDIDNAEEARWRSMAGSKDGSDLSGDEKNMYLYMRSGGVLRPNLKESETADKYLPSYYEGPKNYAATTTVGPPFVPIHAKNYALRVPPNLGEFPSSIVSHDGQNIHDVRVGGEGIPNDAAPFMQLLAQYTRRIRPSTSPTLAFAEALEKYRLEAAKTSATLVDPRPYTPFDFGALRRVTPPPIFIAAKAPAGRLQINDNSDFAAILAQYTKGARPSTQPTLGFEEALAKFKADRAKLSPVTLLPYTPFNFAALSQAFSTIPGALRAMGDLQENDNADFAAILAQFKRSQRVKQTTLPFEEALGKAKLEAARTSYVQYSYTPFDFAAVRRLTPPSSMKLKVNIIPENNDVDFAALLAHFKRSSDVTQNFLPFDFAVTQIMSPKPPEPEGAQKPYTPIDYDSLRRTLTPLKAKYGAALAADDMVPMIMPPNGDVGQSMPSRNEVRNGEGQTQGPRTIIKHFDDVHIDAYFGGTKAKTFLGSTVPAGTDSTVNYPTRIYGVRPEIPDPEVDIGFGFVTKGVIKGTPAATAITPIPIPTDVSFGDTRQPTTPLFTSTVCVSVPPIPVQLLEYNRSSEELGRGPSTSPPIFFPGNFATVAWPDTTPPLKRIMAKAGAEAGELKFSIDRWNRANNIQDDRKGWANINRGSGGIMGAGLDLYEPDKPSINTLEQLAKAFPSDQLTRVEKSVILEGPRIREMREKLGTTSYHFAYYHDRAYTSQVSWKEIKDWVTPKPTTPYPTDPASTIVRKKMSANDVLDWGALRKSYGISSGASSFNKIFHINNNAIYDYPIVRRR